MDITAALAAKSAQLNAIDLVGGPQTVTVVGVEPGPSKEQPCNIITDVYGPERPFRPSATVLRVIANAWRIEGAENPNRTDHWVGRRMTLWRDPDVMWAGKKIGGIRVSAVSHIAQDANLVVPLSKNTWGATTVQPLAAPAPPADTSGRDWLAELEQAGTDIDALRALGNAALEAKAAPNIITAIRAAVTNAQEATQ